MDASHPIWLWPKAPEAGVEAVLCRNLEAIAVLFGKKYLGKVPNDAAGRISLWNDIVKHHTELQDIRAIENFSGENVTVEKGDTKKSVVVTDYVTPVNAMEQLYMTVYVQ